MKEYLHNVKNSYKTQSGDTTKSNSKEGSDSSGKTNVYSPIAEA